MSKWFKVNTAKLQIRTGSGTSYADIGDLFQGDKVETGAYLGGWYQILRIIRVNLMVETPVIPSWCSGAYLVSIAAPVIEPPTQPPADPDYITAHWADGREKRYVAE